MKIDKPFSITLPIGQNTYSFTVRPHYGTETRYSVEYVGDNETVWFQLVKTPIGRWVAGAADIPSWLAEHANELGKVIITASNPGK